MLLVLGVPLTAVMELMEWSDPSVAKRYMHVTDELVIAIAEQVGGHIWAEGLSDQDEGHDLRTPGTRSASGPAFRLVAGGGYGIRTREGCYTQHDFQSCALGRSANPPWKRVQERRATSG